jgi:hypothetical protein
LQRLDHRPPGLFDQIFDVARQPKRSRVSQKTTE